MAFALARNHSTISGNRGQRRLVCPGRIHSIFTLQLTDALFAVDSKLSPLASRSACSTPLSSTKKRCISATMSDDSENVDPAKRRPLSPAKRTRNEPSPTMALRGSRTPTLVPTSYHASCMPSKPAARIPATPVRINSASLRVPSTAPVCRTSTKDILEHSNARRMSVSASSRKPPESTIKQASPGALGPLVLAPPLEAQDRKSSTRPTSSRRKKQIPRNWFFDIHLDDLSQQRNIQTLHNAHALARASSLLEADVAGEHETVEQGAEKENIDPEAPVRRIRREDRRQSSPLPAVHSPAGIPPVSIRAARSTSHLRVRKQDLSPVRSTDPVKRDQAPRVPLSDLLIEDETTAEQSC